VKPATAILGKLEWPTIRATLAVEMKCMVHGVGSELDDSLGEQDVRGSEGLVGVYGGVEGGGVNDGVDCAADISPGGV
jgi:hypothetical protein